LAVDYKSESYCSQHVDGTMSWAACLFMTPRVSEIRTATGLYLRITIIT
jgi:hypothetical protein